MKNESEMKPKKNIKEYERICPDCGGVGLLFPPLDVAELFLAMCKTCKGRGKLDFIDDIKGEKDEGRK